MPPVYRLCGATPVSEIASSHVLTRVVLTRFSRASEPETGETGEAEAERARAATMGAVKRILYVGWGELVREVDISRRLGVCCVRTTD